MAETEGRNRRNTFISPSRRRWRSGIHERRSQQTSPAKGERPGHGGHSASAVPTAAVGRSSNHGSACVRAVPYADCALIFLGLLIATWPSPPWDLLLYGGAVLMVIAPFLFYPFSKTLFLAVDLIVRPPSPEDFTQADQGWPAPRAARTGSTS